MRHHVLAAALFGVNGGACADVEMFPNELYDQSLFHASLIRDATTAAVV